MNAPSGGPRSAGSLPTAHDGRAIPAATPAARERFASKMIVGQSEFHGAPCWVWVGALGGRGYGAFWLDGRVYRAHRVAWAWSGRAIPSGYVLDHQCRNRACVNPLHLSAVTVARNAQLGVKSLEGRGFVCREGHNVRPRSMRASTARVGAEGQPIERCRLCRDIHNRLRYHAARAMGMTIRAYTAAHGASRATAEGHLRAAGIDPRDVADSVAAGYEVTP